MAVSNDKYGPAAKAPLRSRYARARATATASSRGVTPISDDDLELKDRIQLSGDVSVVRMHQLSITLRPMEKSSSSGGRAVRLTASRWEIRKAITSLCCTLPTSIEVEATDKSASIRLSFSVGAAAQDLSNKLRGVTVKIKGIKLHAFVRDISNTCALSEGGDWTSTLLNPNMSENEREAAFERISPGRRPDTIVLRGVPANWLGERGRAAEETCAPGLEVIMSAFGDVRAVEVAPCNPDASSRERPADATRSTSRSTDFDVNALLENMPQPRALAKGKSGGSARRRGGSCLGNGSSSSSSRSGGVDSAVGGVAVDLNVDAWVQFEGFRGFKRALKGLKGRVMQHRNAKLLCEYQLGVDVTGFMTHEQCREREVARAEEARKEARRKNAIDKAKEQLVGLLEGLQGLQGVVDEDARPALQEAVKPTMAKVHESKIFEVRYGWKTPLTASEEFLFEQKTAILETENVWRRLMVHWDDDNRLSNAQVTGYVEKAQALLGVYDVDEQAATAAVTHARGEIAIAKLSIRKAVAGVNKAEEEERKLREREKDEELRSLAQAVLPELEDTLSRGLALVDEQREHSGIKPQADRATELLHELHEACSREGGSITLEGDRLVSDAREAAKTVAIRARIVRRFFGLSARVVELREKADRALGNNHGSLDKANEGEVLSDGAETVAVNVPPSSDNTSCAGGMDGSSNGKCVLVAQLDMAEDMLSRELKELSEDDLSALVASAEKMLEAGSEMLNTFDLVNLTSRQLADTKAAIASGDPLLKSSEGVMRLVAAAVMSMTKAQREGTATEEALTEDPESLLEAGLRWNSAVKAAYSDVAAARQEVERVARELLDRRRREEEEMARKKAEEERLSREEEALKAERAARALEREIDERRRTEAKIFAMELRRKEMVAQVRNKEARERLYNWYKTKKASNTASPAIPDRWTMEEGLETGVGTDSTDGNSGLSTVTGALPTRKEKGVATELTDRWHMNDGSADLAERGLEIVNAGWYLSGPALEGNLSGSSKRRRQTSKGAKEETDWLEAVSKRVRSTITGDVPTDNWAAEGMVESYDGALGERAGDQPSFLRINNASQHSGVPTTINVERRRNDGVRSAELQNCGRERSSVRGGKASSVVGGGKTEAELRQRLLATMGRSK